MGDDLGAGSVPPVRGDGALRLGFAGLSARGWILLAEAASLPLAVPALGLLILLLVGWPLSLAGVGLLLVHLAVPLAAALARWRRDLINRLGRHLPGNYYHDLTFAEVSYRKAGPRRPIRPWDRAVAGPLIWLRDPARWRDLGFLAFTSSAGFAVSVLVVSLPANVATHLILAIVTGKPWWIGLLGPDLALWWLLTPVLARARIRAEQRIFEGSRASRLESRVEAVTTSRAETIDHSSTELRRIERDLHDGAQARIVSAGIYLGLAETLIRDDPEAAVRLLADARSATMSALEDLRSVVRSIHPPVLADRGLAGAVEALALQLAVPVTVVVELPGRPPVPIETAVYFAIAECLANVVKHSRAGRAWVTLGRNGELLRVEVGDDGCGGARAGAGSGLAGVVRRLAAFDGTMTLDSPVGGPTLVFLEVPCGSSSPRT